MQTTDKVIRKVTGMKAVSVNVQSERRKDACWLVGSGDQWLDWAWELQTVSGESLRERENTGRAEGVIKRERSGVHSYIVGKAA